jgi:hypothetical protein
VTVTAVNDYQKEQQFRALNDAREDVDVGSSTPHHSTTHDTTPYNTTTQHTIMRSAQEFA